MNPLYVHLVAGGLLINCPPMVDHVWVGMGCTFDDCECDGTAIRPREIVLPCTHGHGGLCVTYTPGIVACWDFDCGGPCDIDFDGDSGTDQDIAAFFDLHDGLWPLVSDFDGDGEPGTEADIAAFFQRLAQ